jgi:hypothetical protein
LFCVCLFDQSIKIDQMDRSSDHLHCGGWMVLGEEHLRLTSLLPMGGGTICRKLKSGHFGGTHGVKAFKVHFWGHR